MSLDKTSGAPQIAGDERITVENMALLCHKVKLDIAPVQLPDINVAQVSFTLNLVLVCLFEVLHRARIKFI